MYQDKFPIRASFVLLIALVSLCSVVKAQSSKITISGELKNLSVAKLSLMLEEDINRKKNRLIAEIPVTGDGSFKFEGNLSPHLYSLKINNQKLLPLAIDKGQSILISGDVLEFDRLKVTGSADTSMLHSYETFRKESLNRLVVSVRNKIKNLAKQKIVESDPQMIELAKLEIVNYEKHQDELIEYIKREMGTSIAVYATSVRWVGGKNLNFLNELTVRFEEAHPNLEITEKIKEKVRIMNGVSVGGKVPEIRMPNAAGEIISLSSIKARYILIDFWGSWCAPCRRESADLAKVRQKFGAKGFEIFGVGLETEEKAWLDAIKNDKRNWIHVSKFEEFESSVAFDFAVTSLPANFLIDGNGKVVARNLHGKELEAKLDELYRVKD